MLPVTYYKQNLSLAIPIMLSSLGQSLVQMIDTLMVGRLGTDSLAAISFASMICIDASMLGMGIAMALTPLTGQSYAKKEKNRIAILLQNSLSLNTIVSLCLIAVLFALLPCLSHMGQAPKVVELCKPYYILVTLSLLPMMIFLSFKQFMEGIDNTKVAMIITIGTNVLNVVLNYVLIYGKFGMPCLGLTGAAVSTLVSRIVAPIVFFVYIKHKEVYGQYLKMFNRHNLSAHIHKILLKTGTPIASQMFAEMFAFFMVGLMMGWISEYHLAAYQIVNTIISTAFLAASGICSATTVLVSHSYGLRQRREMKKYFFSGWQMVIMIMGVFGVILIVFGRFLASIFSTDSQVIDIAAGLFIVAGVFEVIDGTQVSGLSGLRGMNDVFKPMVYAVVIYVLVAIPLAYLSVFVLKLPAWSMLGALELALLFAAFLYHRRFYKMIKSKNF